jgi:hypothetical protein
MKFLTQGSRQPRRSGKCTWHDGLAVEDELPTEVIIRAEDFLFTILPQKKDNDNTKTSTQLGQSGIFLSPVDY